MIYVIKLVKKDIFQSHMKVVEMLKAIYEKTFNRT